MCNKVVYIVAKAKNFAMKTSIKSVISKVK